MKTLLILLLAGIQVQVFAQFEEFWPINSEGWITEYNANGPPQANYRFYVEEDTLIGDYTYKVLMRDRINPYTASTTTKLFAYFREEDGVITYYDETTGGEWSYFDQNATIGDTIKTIIHPDQQMDGCDEYRTYVVDSLSDTTISGTLLKVFFLKAAPFSCYDEYAFFWESGKFIESIGFLAYPTPYLNAGAFDGDFPGMLKCYENDQLGLVQFITEPCDFLETGIVQASLPEFNVFPNPANAVVQIDCGLKEVDRYSLMNALGQPMYSCEVQNNIRLITVDVSTIPEGIYFLQMHFTDGSIGKSAFVRN
ncbi:MAG TPA: T9SS type A sorting domain-containing protein [Chitinophagales bacterium]|nr:T9SS type A sorting domain-containing protein [Chitinophagales bacterium]HMX03421.1 T9SS type A sorting domain-containing protein [Chitinophagales bacterium]HNF70121.1 T9SS type A sorting domain-containing protein [Chitinophagales bacterium]HNJ88102.1 T9SS type A sorting domain-containing protein [Chitinophagales bacterium]HNK97759.1 T9SS type A sorting domain-containing protein [Chitinophagales bacterium]